MAAPAGTTPIRTRMLGRTLQQAVLRGMREHPDLASTASGAPEVRLVGLDPVRLLVVGSGLAVGYGVSSHRDALTGALAAAVQADGERGVIVQNRAVAMRGVEQTVAEFGNSVATTFRTVVWCPSLFDVLRSPDRGRYRRALLEGLGLLRETARPGAEIVVCALPVPTGRGPGEEIARLLVPRYNAALARAVAPLPGVRVAATPDFTSLLDPGAFSPGYYRRWAAEILPEAVQGARSA